MAGNAGSIYGSTGAVQNTLRGAVVSRRVFVTEPPEQDTSTGWNTVVAARRNVVGESVQRRRGTGGNR